jgi:hypothetical protein
METLFVTKEKKVLAIQITSSVSIRTLKQFFDEIGYELVRVKKVSESPFIEYTTYYLLDLVHNEKEITVMAKLDSYISFENGKIVNKELREFEENFEPIEPILQELENEMFQS